MKLECDIHYFLSLCNNKNEFMIDDIIFINYKWVLFTSILPYKKIGTHRAVVAGGGVTWPFYFKCVVPTVWAQQRTQLENMCWEKCSPDVWSLWEVMWDGHTPQCAWSPDLSINVWPFFVRSLPLLGSEYCAPCRARVTLKRFQNNFLFFPTYVVVCM